MKTDIRKISVGKDYPDGAMHYQVGKEIKLQGIPFIVSHFLLNKEYEGEGKKAYDVCIKNKEGAVVWKTLVDMPMVIENNVNFE